MSSQPAGELTDGDLARIRLILGNAGAPVDEWSDDEMLLRVRQAIKNIAQVGKAITDAYGPVLTAFRVALEPLRTAGHEPDHESDPKPPNRGELDG